ncbi:hypothetical protein [Streptomyces sp. 3214.6]|uniref:hypothetical protein n=1 Tax=Streptomyces sp. 3214.6 TaxID=1882757 RepID=UPI00090B2C77|nr:hypothetical protein [Streptomyces sp. 3214.6]SHI24137.1 hypothetical protein SAMN05444521_5999 [Streptomyces sp. 3214.6]
MQNRLTTYKHKTAVVAAMAAFVVAVPTVSALAAEISGSRLPFAVATAGSAEDSNRWSGPGSGHVKACGDVPVNDTRTFTASVWRDISLSPDREIATASRSYSQGYGCGAYKDTSTSNKYYTQVSWAAVPGSRGVGFAAAEN